MKLNDCIDATLGTNNDGLIVYQDVTDTGVGMDLAPSMDIFSAGCVLIELFTDSPPFSLQKLLAYKAGEYSPDRVLDKIDDPDMKVCKLCAIEGPCSFCKLSRIWSLIDHLHT